MTPDYLLHAVLQDIYLALTVVEGEGQIYLITGDFKSFKETLLQLIGIAKALGIDIQKYDYSPNSKTTGIPEGSKNE